MSSALDAVINPLKSAINVAQGLVEVRDTVKFGNAVIDLQGKIMAAQQGAFAAQERQTAMAEEIRQFKERVAELETWDAERKRYQLTDFGAGTFAYLIKDDLRGPEPPHRICANCFQQGHKSVLQFQHDNSYSQDVYSCPSCKTEFSFGVRRDRIAGSSPKGGSWMA